METNCNVTPRGTAGPVKREVPLNNYQYEMDLKSAFAETTGPCTVMWVITNLCNLCCLHCYNDSSPKGSAVGELSQAERWRIAEQLREIKPFTVCMCGGEVLVLPDFLDICRFLAEDGIMVNMVTNGLSVTPTLARQIREAGLKLVQVSLDGATAQTHDAIRGKGSFQRAVNAIRLLKEVGYDNPAVTIIPNKLNYRDVDAWFALCRELGTNNVRSMPLMPVGRAVTNWDKLALSASELAEVSWKMKEAKKRHPDMQVEWGDPMEHISNFSQADNPMHTFDAEIRPDGKLLVSAYLPLTAGDLRRHSFKEYWDAGYKDIWRHPRVQEYTQKIRCLDDLGLQPLRPWTEDEIDLDLLPDSRCAVAEGHA